LVSGNNTINRHCGAKKNYRGMKKGIGALPIPFSTIKIAASRLLRRSLHGNPRH
jgi:hypothetical protein